ncbi:MAG: DUF4335 domain-containing protein [Cyanobacteria bacterium P01_D01_bin.123]
MASTPISRIYQQSTCTLTVTGQTTQPEDLSAISGNLNCQLDLKDTRGSHQLTGDLALLQDLAAVLERYAQSLLSGQPQGTFSGTVAIRPLAYVIHRMTVRQGTGIGQADLSASQLFDLTEALAELRATVPHLNDLKLTQPKSWYAQPTGIAALLVGGVGVAAAIAVLATGGGETTLRQQESRTDSNSSEIALSESTLPAAPDARRGTLPEGTPQGSDEQDGDVARLSADSELSDNAASSDTSPARPAAPPALSAAVENPDQPERPSDSDRGEALRQEWEEAWVAPIELDVDWAYTVVIEPDGAIVSALPIDEAAAAGKEQTPFAEVPTTSPATLPAEAQIFTVTFSPDGSVTTAAAE